MKETKNKNISGVSAPLYFFFTFRIVLYYYILLI
nr:MAG TPA: hypothetical protein [Caudoviricetes sp.]